MLRDEVKLHELWHTKRAIYRQAAKQPPEVLSQQAYCFAFLIKLWNIVEDKQTSWVQKTFPLFAFFELFEQ